MIAFEVLLNGAKIYTIGVDDPGMVTAYVTRERKRHARRMAVGLSATGADFAADGCVEYLEWAGRPLAVGDVVTIRVVETDVIDEPAKRQASDPALNEQRKRRIYEQWKAEYEE